MRIVEFGMRNGLKFRNPPSTTNHQPPTTRVLRCSTAGTNHHQSKIHNMTQNNLEGNSQSRFSPRKHATRRGAIMPMIAIMLPVILILASFVVNLSYMELTRTELRIANDSATRAAGRILIATGDKAQARAAAREAGTRNFVANQPLQLADADIVFGEATRASAASRYIFTPGGSQNNAVQINARRSSGSMDGVVNMVIPTFGGPTSFEPEQSAVSNQVELDIALVLDRSGSMAYGDFEDSLARATAGLGPAIAIPGWWFGDAAPIGSRWLDLVAAVNVFIGELNSSPQDEYMSLVTYSTTAQIEVDLTNNYSAVPTAMDAYTQSLNAGKTNIHAGIAAGLNTLADPGFARIYAAKVIIVLTDGNRNEGPNPTTIAATAFGDGVTIFTVTFSNDANQPSMVNVADDGGGKHFFAATSSDLANVFRDIAKSLPTLLTR